jgi:hypothetical protein
MDKTLVGYNQNMKTLTGVQDSTNNITEIGDTIPPSSRSNGTRYVNQNPITNTFVNKYEYVLFSNAGNYTFNFTNDYNKFIKFYYFVIGGGGSGGSGGFYTPNYGGGGG